MLFTGKIYFLNFSITQFSGGLKDNYELKNDAYDVSWSGMTPYLANCKVWDIWQIAELRVCDIMTADSIIWDRFKVQVCGFRFFFLHAVRSLTPVCCVAVQPLPALWCRGVRSADGRCAVSNSWLWSGFAAWTRSEENCMWDRKWTRLRGKTIHFSTSSVGKKKMYILGC